MLKTAPRTKHLQDQANRVAAASLHTVKTLFRASIGTIAFIRALLPEDCLGTEYIASSRKSGSGDSQGGGPRFKYIKRGFSTEADSLLDYLEKGIFDALEKQYLKSFVFALYVDENDPNNLIESYTFHVSYHEVGPNNVRAPSISLESGFSSLGLSQDNPAAAAARTGRVPTLGDVKESMTAIIVRLTSSIQHWEALPDHRFATFKLYYYDHTPQDYEPPNFVPGNAEKDRYFFATHNVGQPPKRYALRDLDTINHGFRLEMATICSYIPTIEDNAAPFMPDTNLVHHPETSDEAADGRRAGENAKLQLADAENRQIIWDADVPVSSEAGTSYVGPSQLPIGVRRGGELAFIPWKGKGKEKETVKHRGGKHQVPDLYNAGGPSTAHAEEATQLFETQATVIIPQTQDDTAMDVDVPNDSQDRGQTSTTQVTVVSQGLDTAIPASASTASRIHPNIDPAAQSWKPVECDCNINSEDCETFICSGPCKRRLHAWCMGFHTAEKAVYSVDSACLTCSIKSFPRYDLLTQPEKQKVWVELVDLAVFRRSLKFVYTQGYPGNPHAFRKMIGCSRAEAANYIARLKNEGFLECRILQFDPFGITATTVPAKNGQKKQANKKGQVKEQIVPIKSETAMRSLERYFEPRGELVKELLSKNRLVKNKDITRATGNVLVPSSSTSYPSQDPTPPAPSSPVHQTESQTQENSQTHRNSQTQEDTQTQEKTQLFVEPLTPTPRTSSKRRVSARISENRAKKMKVSLAKSNVDLQYHEYA